MAAPNISAKRDRLIELGGRIAALRARKAEIVGQLRAAEAEFDALLRDEPETVPAQDGPSEIADQATPPPADDTSFASRVEHLINSRPGHSFSVSEIATRLNTDKVDSLRSTLLRLHTEGRIAKLARGTYAAAPKGVHD